MKPSFRIFLVGLFVAILGVVVWFKWRDDAEPLPDERKVAMELLEDKQSGPGYFHPVTSPTTPDENGILWINSAEATGQIDRVIGERKLDEPAKGKILKLIQETSEPHPSRIVGGERINLARLNVALDALK